MSRLHTTLIWHDSRGGEHDAAVIVTYSVTPGYPQTWNEPGAADEVEIGSIVAAGGGAVPDHFLTDDELLAECLAAWRDERIADGEARAEARRDDLMMERF